MRVLTVFSGMPTIRAAFRRISRGRGRQSPDVPPKAAAGTSGSAGCGSSAPISCADRPLNRRWLRRSLHQLRDGAHRAPALPAGCRSRCVRSEPRRMPLAFRTAGSSVSRGGQCMGSRFRYRVERAQNRYFIARRPLAGGRHADWRSGLWPIDGPRVAKLPREGRWIKGLRSPGWGPVTRRPARQGLRQLRCQPAEEP